MRHKGLPEQPSILDLVKLLSETLESEKAKQIPTDSPTLIEFKRQIVLQIAELSVTESQDHSI